MDKKEEYSPITPVERVGHQYGNVTASPISDLISQYLSKSPKVKKSPSNNSPFTL